MKHLIRLAIGGNSVSFNISRIIKQERLPWKEGDFFQVTVKDENEINIQRISVEKRKNLAASKKGAILKSV